MKKYNIICILFALLAFSTGCDDDKLTLDRIDSVVIRDLPTENLLLEAFLQDDDKNPLLFTVKWSKADFIVDGASTPAVPFTYNVEIDHWGIGFTNPQIITATSADSVDVFVNDLNTLLVKEMEAQPHEAAKFELRVTVKYGEGVGKTSVSSNVQVLTITPYEMAELGPLQGVYIVGDMNGWNTRSTDFRIFRANNNADTRIYTYTGHLNGYFKFILEEGIGGEKMFYAKEDGELAYGVYSEGAFYVNGKYVTITLDLDNMTWTMIDFDESKFPTYGVVCFVGDFCNWGAEGADPEMTKSANDHHIWELKEIQVDVPGYGVKFRADHGWDNRWCPTNNTDIPYGIGRLNPPSTDDPNISITEAGRYYVKFNDLTGHYIVEYLK